MTKVYIWKFNSKIVPSKDDPPLIGIIAETLEEARSTFIKNYNNMIYWQGAYSRNISNFQNEIKEFIKSNEPFEVKNNSNIFVMTSLSG